ncbi:Heavy metal-associated domain containing protein [Fagus crenata]
MALVNQPKKELPGSGARKSKSLLLSGTSLASVESLSMPLVQEVVLSADIQCSECQKRVADIMSKMTETESVVVNVLEKKVTLTCRYANVRKASSQQAAAIYRNPLGKVSIIKRIFRSSRR